ncbi:hypothetical protein [Hymenobacter sp.]|uniref:hypothetical protein n=1 Tax=Hymenobacter sp. TaxID=1898978 RepID=UPI00286A6C67|nr:hypothetical protein [Hymenobacter sp.]
MMLIPDGATWFFRVHDDRFGLFMTGFDCIQIGPSDWKATVGREERQKLLELLQWDDGESYWYFGSAESIEIEFDGRCILRGHDGMGFVCFSKHFHVPEVFRLRYFIDGEGCAGQAEDW